MKVKRKFRIAIMASGNGTNAENIIHYFHSHKEIEVGLLMCNSPGAYVLQRAKNLSIPAKVFNRADLNQQALNWLLEYEITHIVLAGFLWLLPEKLIETFSDRIINIHPALLPKYGGKGMYGARVHERVKADEAAVTGITIHLVNEKYDEGRVLFQLQCDINPSDTVDDIASKVHALEYSNYPRIIEKWILNLPIR